MNELQVVKSYLNTRIECLEREQGKHTFNEKQLNELRDMRRFVDGLGGCCKKDNAISMGELLAMLDVLDKAEDTLKKQCDCDKD